MREHRPLLKCTNVSIRRDEEPTIFKGLATYKQHETEQELQPKPYAFDAGDGDSGRPIPAKEDQIWVKGLGYGDHALGFLGNPDII